MSPGHAELLGLRSAEAPSPRSPSAPALRRPRGHLPEQYPQEARLPGGCGCLHSLLALGREDG
eukprot:1447115-Alexandrium_andersonii.AAC.1